MTDVIENLGELRKVEVRKVWKNEARNFTPWLAQEENLSKLGDEIGIEISLEQTEATVGSFNVDILAREEGTGRIIIIENQFGATNHDHLGKLITYASGHEAEIIIWVVEETREEHQRAIEWLNEHSDEQLNVFIVRIEVWQIDNSKLAPKFQVIASPNEWAKTIRKTSQQAQLTETKLMQLEFWHNFKEYAEHKKFSLKLRKPLPQHWYDMALNTQSNITLTINTHKQQLAVEVYIHNSKDLYHKYFSNKDVIEKELGMKLEWMELPGKKASRIKISKDTDFEDQKGWSDEYEWLRTTAEAFQRVFSKYT